MFNFLQISRIHWLIVILLSCVLSCSEPASDQSVNVTSDPTTETVTVSNISGLDNIDITCERAASYSSSQVQEQQNSVYFGCILEEKDGKRFTGTIEDPNLLITYNDGTEEDVNTVVMTSGDWDIVFPLNELKIKDIDSIKASLTVDESIAEFEIEIVFSAMSSLLTFENGSSYNFGKQAIRFPTDASFKIVYTGEFPALITSISGGISGAIKFKGGAYPGTGGTCDSVISADCNIILTFTPTELDNNTAEKTYSETITLNYFNGLEDRTLSLSLTGTSTLMADLVVGQNNMSTGSANQDGANSGQATLYNPRSVYKVLCSDSVTRVFVADTDNHRVLIWNGTPSSSGTNADVVLGQANFTSNSENAGGSPAANTLRSPYSLYSDGTSLFVADTGNHRVLIWDTIPTQNQEPANRVLGQASMTGGTANRGTTVIASAQSFWNPGGISGDTTHIYVADASNSRVLVWNSNLPANDAAANIVLGQSTMSAKNANRGGSANADTLNIPKGTYSNGTYLFVSDRSNNRVLIYTVASLSTGINADLVLGQANMTTSDLSSENPDASTLNNLRAIFSYGTKLSIVDEYNHRILIWNTLPTTNGQAADTVFGQLGLSLESGLSNTGSGGPSAYGLNKPQGIFVDSTNLYVADTENHRILKVPLP